MSIAAKIKDSFLTGLITGLASIFLFYYLLSVGRTLLVNYYQNPYMLKPPVVQLLTMLINIIIFRFLLIKFDREKTAKGILFITVVLTLIYFYFFFKANK